LALLMGEMLGDHIAQFARGHPELVEQQRRMALAELDRLRLASAPRAATRWAVAEQYRGIEHAQLVVVNIRGQAERDSGEVLLAEVARLRTDQASSTMSWAGAAARCRSPRSRRTWWTPRIQV
jgi:hypothetical protein